MLGTHRQCGSIGEQFVVKFLCCFVLLPPCLRDLSLGGEDLVVLSLPLVHGLVLLDQEATDGAEVFLKDGMKLFLL